MGKEAEIIFYRITPEIFDTVYKMETQAFPAMWNFDYFQKIVTSGNVLPLVAKMNEKIIAYILLGFSEGTVTFIRFVIAPEFRKRGFGKIILSGTLDFIRQKKWGGVEIVDLHVNTENFAAIRLYEKCGFKIVERIENYYKNDGTAAFKMERKI